MIICELCDAKQTEFSLELGNVKFVWPIKERKFCHNCGNPTILLVNREYSGDNRGGFPIR